MTSSATAEIRKKLNIAFDDLTLSSFCFDYFPTVCDTFAEGMRKDKNWTLDNTESPNKSCIEVKS